MRYTFSGDGDNANDTELQDNMIANINNVDFFHGVASGGGKPSPILEPEHAKFFILLAATQTDLSISTETGEWYVQAKHAKKLNEAYHNTNKKAKRPQVMIFFTVSDSRHIQGAAIMTSEAKHRENVIRKEFVGNTPLELQFSCRFSVEWYRTTEMSTTTALGAASDLSLPTSQTELCKEMSWKTGESLMKAVWNSPLVTLYESWGENYGDNGGDYKEPPAPDALLTDFRCPSPDEVPWPVLPGPGFIFGCSSDTMDECLGGGILGLPMHMKGAAQWIVPGTSVFLFNVTDRLLFGVFEALTPARVNMEPTAFSKNPKATSSPFPVQIRVRVSLECPPLEDTDPILNDILRSRGKSGRIGSLTFAQTEAIASLLASQCGALQYMMDYQQGLWEGVEVNPPPIALPPKVDSTTNNVPNSSNNDMMHE
jgi:cleavage and polyadenylation specificity factor subunit 4